MINNTNTQLKAYQVSNSSLNDVNSSVKVRNSSLYATNSSLSNSVSKQPAKCSKSTKFRPLLKGEKKWCNTGDYPFFNQVCKETYSLAIPSVMLSDIACDISGAINALNDIGQILHLIHKGELSSSQISSIARLSNDAAERWTTLLHHQLDTINKPLAQSAFGTEVAS